MWLTDYHQKADFSGFWSAIQKISQKISKHILILLRHGVPSDHLQDHQCCKMLNRCERTMLPVSAEASLVQRQMVCYDQVLVVTSYSYQACCGRVQVLQSDLDQHYLAFPMSTVLPAGRKPGLCAADWCACEDHPINTPLRVMWIQIVTYTARSVTTRQNDYTKVK